MKNFGRMKWRTKKLFTCETDKAVYLCGWRVSEFFSFVAENLSLNLSFQFYLSLILCFCLSGPLFMNGCIPVSVCPCLYLPVFCLSPILARPPLSFSVSLSHYVSIPLSMYISLYISILICINLFFLFNFKAFAVRFLSPTLCLVSMCNQEFYREHHFRRKY